VESVWASSNIDFPAPPGFPVGRHLWSTPGVWDATGSFSLVGERLTILPKPPGMTMSGSLLAHFLVREELVVAGYSCVHAKKGKK
jgi:hypothetical protein